MAKLPQAINQTIDLAINQAINRKFNQAIRPAIGIALLLAAATPLAAENVSTQPSSSAKAPAREAGFGIGTGALIGGLIGGPPGAIIGAAGGAWFGERSARKRARIASLEDDLTLRAEEFANLQYEFDQTQLSTVEAMRQVRVKYIQTAEDLLPSGLSFDLYFRTNSAEINPQLQPHIKQLSEFLTNAPGLKVHLSGYADERGSETYNLDLSKQRIEAVQRSLIDSGLPGEQISDHAYGEKHTDATDGDMDGYAFDRKVSIVVSADEEA